MFGTLWDWTLRRKHKLLYTHALWHHFPTGTTCVLTFGRDERYDAVAS